MSTEFLLVVDDEPLLLDTCCLVLEEAGFSVVCVDSPDDAERVLTESGQNVTALITDISLGSGKRTGWELAVRAREIKPEVPVIYLTGASGGDEADKSRVPDGEILPKPFMPEQLVQLVRRII